MSDIIDGTVSLNPLEINRLIKTAYKISPDDQIALNNSMNRYKELKDNYESDLKELSRDETESFQKKYNYELYKNRYEILDYQMTITGKAYRIKRLGYIRDILLAKNNNANEMFIKLCRSYVDNIFQEAMNDIKLLLEFYKIQPHFRMACLNYFYDIYREIEREKVKLEFQPKLRELKESYNTELKSIIQSTQALTDKSEFEIREIITKKKALLEEKSKKELDKVNSDLIDKEQERSRLKKTNISYSLVMDLIKIEDDFFAKVKLGDSLKEMDPSVVANLFRLEESYLEVKSFLHELTDTRIENNKEKIYDLEKSKSSLNKYSVKDEDDSVIKHRKGAILKDIQDKMVRSFYSGTIKSGLLVMDDNLEVINELLIFAGYEKREDKEKTRSS